MRKILVAAALLGAFPLAGCQTTDNREEQVVRESAAVRGLGEPFKTPLGDVHFARIQDEYRLIRCIPETTAGALAGCYEDIFSVQRDALSDDPSDGVNWNSWIVVTRVPGLEVAFLDPSRVAFRLQPRR
jgi:hypothetical protein